jgi:type I restriction enzyme S subunit
MNLQKDNWEKVKLGTVCSFKNGFNYNKGNLSNGVKVIGVIDFQDYFVPKFDNLSELIGDKIPSNDFLIKPNDILFVRSNGNKELVGRALFIDHVPFPTTFSAFCIRARFIDQKFYPKFYAYYFRSDYFKSKLRGIAQGTNINNLST